MDPLKSTTSRNDAKEYLAEKEIPQLFESILTGLMYSRPEDPLQYLEECINKSKESGMENIMWDTFALKKDPLPPIPTTPRQETQTPQEQDAQQAQCSASGNETTLNPFTALPPIGFVVPPAQNEGQQNNEQTEQQQVEQTAAEEIQAEETEENNQESGETEKAAEDQAWIPIMPVEPAEVKPEFTREPDEKPLFILVIGGVGSWKKEHYPFLKEKYGLEVIQLGSLIEQEVKSDSELGNEIKTVIDKGEEISEDVCLQLISQEVGKINSNYGYVLDGFPRSVSMLEKFQAEVDKVSLVFYFEQSEESLANKIEESTNQSATEDVESYNAIIGPLLTHFEEQQILRKVEDTGYEYKQWDILKMGLAELGFKADESNNAAESAEAEVQEESVIPEEAVNTGEDEESVPKQIEENEEDAAAAVNPEDEQEEAPKDAVEEDAVVPEEAVITGGDEEASSEPDPEVSFGMIINSATTEMEKYNELLKDQLGFTCFDISQLMMSEVEQSSNVGQALKKLMFEAKQLPDDLVMSVLLGNLLKSKRMTNSVISGFPQTPEQLEKFESHVGQMSFALYHEQSDEEMKEFYKSKDPEMTDEQIDSEVGQFRNNVKAVLETLEAKGVLVKVSSAEPDDEFKEMLSAKLTSCQVNRQAMEAANEELMNKADQFLNTPNNTDMKSVFENLPVVFVTGGPGSGKGTQCAKIVEKFNFTHLSSGDLLRAKVASGSPDGQELDAMMKAGELVPLEKVLELITEAMTAAVAAGSCKGFLIDGYPREIEQGIKFEEQIKPCSLVIDFDVPDEIMVERLIKRGETSGRLDDNEETIRARLQTYRDATVPVAEHYKQQNKLVSIDANRSVDEIFQDACNALSSIGIESSSCGFSQPVFFIVGGPGSGKGTQCEKIVAEFNFTHLSSGDLLRAEVQSGSEKGKALDEAMKAGELVTTETVLDLMREAMEKVKDTSKGYLIDGYPRKVEQGELFEKNVAPCTACIFFNLPAEVMKERLLKRGETSGRVDDNEETIGKRLETFDNETKPVLEYYKEKQKLHDIDAERTIDEIYADVRTALLPFVQQ